METNNIFDDLEALYGSKLKAAEAIGVCKRTYDYWRAAGEITQLPAQRLAALLIAINHMPQRTRKRWLQ